MHYEADEDRLCAAEQLAGHQPRHAAEAFAALASDGDVGDEVRLAAAGQLANLRPSRATASRTV